MVIHIKLGNANKISTFFFKDFKIKGLKFCFHFTFKYKATFYFCTNL